MIRNVQILFGVGLGASTKVSVITGRNCTVMGYSIIFSSVSPPHPLLFPAPVEATSGTGPVRIFLKKPSQQNLDSLDANMKGASNEKLRCWMSQSYESHQYCYGQERHSISSVKYVHQIEIFHVHTVCAAHVCRWSGLAHFFTYMHISFAIRCWLSCVVDVINQTSRPYYLSVKYQNYLRLYPYRKCKKITSKYSHC